MEILNDPIIPPPLTIQEFMRVARVSDDTVRRWIKAGRIETFRIGRRVLIPRTEAEKLLNRPTEANGR